MKEHDLKTWPSAWEDVRDGRKTFEVRSNRDRDFEVGDVLLLRKWCPDKQAYCMPESAAHPAWTGLPGSAATLRMRVIYVLHGGRFELPEGVCVMGIVPRPEP